MTEKKSLEEAIGETVPAIELELVRRGIKDFDDPTDRANYMLGCAVNLVGNISAHLVNDDIEQVKMVGEKVIARIREWFDESIKYLSTMEKH